MNKLYPGIKYTLVMAKETVVVQDTDEQNDKLVSELKSCVEGYCNVSELYESVAGESYTLVDNKNKVLFNAYSKLMHEKLGVSMTRIKEVSTESLDGASGIAVNSEIALEGWVSSLWDKIKLMFKKIYENIQAFFKKHFTRLGRAKKALENIRDVLKKTDKELGGDDPSSYKGSLYKKYAGYGTVSPSNVKKALANVNRLALGISKVNAKAEVMAKSHMVDQEFFTKIKALRDQAAGASASKDEIDKDTPGLARAALTGRLKERGDKKDESKTLGETAKDAEGKANSADAEVSSASTADVGSEEGNLKAAKDQMDGFLKEITTMLTPSINSLLVSGKMIKSVATTDAMELDVEMDASGEDANQVTLGAKTDLSSIVNLALGYLADMEKNLKTYGDINDVIMKNLSLVDRLVSEIDKVDPVKYGKYRKLVNEQVRERLQLMRKFFSGYNKVAKNVLELGLDSYEGAADFSLLSLKYFK